MANTVINVGGKPIKVVDNLDDTYSAKAIMEDGDNATLGTKADLAITDPTLSASEIAILKGMMKQLQGNGVGSMPVSINGSLANVLDCTIPIGGTVSNEVDISQYRYFSFLMPAGWDAATLTIQGSAVAGGTKRTIKNDVGVTFPVMTVAVDTIYAIDLNALMLAGVFYVSFVASAAQTTAARTIKLMCKS